MLGLFELLSLRHVSCDPKRTKLVRHKDQRFDLQLFKRRGWLEIYQAFQSRPIFHGCDTILTFMGEEEKRSRLLGMYKVAGHQPADGVSLPAGCPSAVKTGGYFYTLERLAGLEDLEGRVVIDWGRNPIAWHQWLTDRELIEISPPGQSRAPFRDYLEFTLTHEELCDLATHAAANREWQARLEAVGGVYLILATTNGQQYVGSATGAGGVWDRWMGYARTGHGGNAALRALLANDKNYPAAFQYSLLQVFSKTLTRAEALDHERLYKTKLGSRAQGLQLN